MGSSASAREEDEKMLKSEMSNLVCSNVEIVGKKY
jgi:hypothetical protein